MPVFVFAIRLAVGVPEVANDSTRFDQERARIGHQKPPATGDRSLDALRQKALHLSLERLFDMDQIIERWRRAEERVLEEGVKILEIGGEYRATSTSTALASYRLYRTTEGWGCECPANAQYGRPCKHLAALSENLGIDLLSDVRLDWELAGETRHPAA